METMTKKQIREEEIKNAISELRHATAREKIDSIFFEKQGVKIYYYKNNGLLEVVVIPFKDMVESGLFFDFYPNGRGM